MDSRIQEINRFLWYWSHHSEYLSERIKTFLEEEQSRTIANCKKSC
jgi:hypothetical protein